MKTSRLRVYILLSVVLHGLVLGLLRFRPTPQGAPPAPVAIRILEAPPPQPSLPPSVRLQEPTRQPPELPKQAPEKPPEKVPAPEQVVPNRPASPAQPGRVLAELPKPVQEQKPDDARIVSRYDSKAQDIGPGEGGTRKPSGEQPPQMPPELALPERYSRWQPAPEPSAPSSPAPPAPTQLTPSPPTVPPAAPPTLAQPPPPAPAVPPPPTPPARAQRAPTRPAPTPPARQAPQLQARQTPAPESQARLTQKRPPEAYPGTVPAPTREPPPATATPTPEGRQFQFSPEQEVAMLQRDQRQATSSARRNLEEHFASLEKRLPLPSFDAPGVYERGPERPGEGRGDDIGGGKYHSIDSFSLKHYSYLLGIKRKIELVFSVPFFMPNNGAVGVPIVGFTIRRNGELSEAVLLRSSGYTVVDKALLEAVKRAAPYGPFPEHLADPEISIRVYATVS
jgi:TonB family protein